MRRRGQQRFRQDYRLSINYWLDKNQEPVKFVYNYTTKVTRRSTRLFANLSVYGLPQSSRGMQQGEGPFEQRLRRVKFTLQSSPERLANSL